MQSTGALWQPIALTVDDAAAELCCSRTTVYRLINEGRLKSFKVGRLRRVVTESIYELTNTDQAEY